MKKFSWKTLDDGRLVKELDFSSFNHRGSGVPQDFYSFFEIGGENIPITLLKGKTKYKADLNWTRPESPIVRIFWKENFTSALKKEFPEWKNIKPGNRSSNMKLVFKKTSETNVFDVDFLDENSTENEKINFEATVASKLKTPPKKKPKGSKKPIKKTQSSEQIVRDPEVHAWILNNSKWVCECCNKAAPFSKTDGYKYLEVHHVKRLADGGSDTIANAIAVCPNCHRELHYGENRDNLVNSLYKKTKRLIRE